MSGDVVLKHSSFMQHTHQFTVHWRLLLFLVLFKKGRIIVCTKKGERQWLALVMEGSGDTKTQGLQGLIDYFGNQHCPEAKSI